MKDRRGASQQCLTYLDDEASDEGLVRRAQRLQDLVPVLVHELAGLARVVVLEHRVVVVQDSLLRTARYHELVRVPSQDDHIALSDQGDPSTHTHTA